MNKEAHPFTQLRRKIRQTGKQFRQNNDNSQSIFHPSGGFTYAYDMSGVEDALDFYENTLPKEYQEQRQDVSVEDRIMADAKEICATSPDMAMRDFARTVAGYMVMAKSPERAKNPLKLLNSNFLVPIQKENDSFDD